MTATDISEAMAQEAKRRYEEAVRQGAPAPKVPPVFAALDLESIDGSFHTVCCIDVLIHYPQARPPASPLFLIYYPQARPPASRLFHIYYPQACAVSPLPFLS